MFKLQILYNHSIIFCDSVHGTALKSSLGTIKKKTNAFHTLTCFFFYLNKKISGYIVKQIDPYFLVHN